jgi:hypothetical protein
MVSFEDYDRGGGYTPDQGSRLKESKSASTATRLSPDAPSVTATLTSASESA